MELGVKVEVVGQIIPYSFADGQTGEAIGLVHLRVPGDVVSVNVEPHVAEKMREGETWRVSGGAIVRKKKAQLHINAPEMFKRLSAPRGADGPKIDFGLDSESAVGGSAAKAR